MQHEVFEHELDGGAKGLVVHVPGAQVTNLVVSFNSGFQFGDPDHYELPHVMEHLLASGSTKTHPEHARLIVEIQKNGAYHNAYTNSATNGYVWEMGGFETDRMLSLLKEYFTEQLFTEDDISTEISNVRQELTQAITDHARFCSVEFLRHAYPERWKQFDERLKQLPGIGRAETVGYFKKSHTWNNMRVYLSGDFADRGQGAMEAVKANLGGLPKGSRFEPDYSPGDGFEPVAVRRDIEQIYYNLGWGTKALPEDLWPAGVILRTVLGEGFGSRIFGEARHRGLVYGIGVSVDFDPGSADLAFRGFVTPDNIKPLYELIAKQVVEVREGKLTDQEVAVAKDLRTGSQLRAYQTSGQLLSWYMAHYEERGVIEDFNGWIDKLRAVTREQVVEVANHLCKAQMRGATFVGPVSDEEGRKYSELLDSISTH